MVYVINVIILVLYSWLVFKTGKKSAESKDKIKLVITGKPEQVKEAIKTINEQDYLLK